MFTVQYVLTPERSWARGKLPREIMRRNFLYMGTQQCVNVPAGHKQRLRVGHWFSACCSRTRIKQKCKKAHNAVMQCGFILINKKLYMWPSKLTKRLPLNVFNLFYATTCMSITLPRIKCDCRTYSLSVNWAQEYCKFVLSILRVSYFVTSSPVAVFEAALIVFSGNPVNLFNSFNAVATCV